LPIIRQRAARVTGTNRRRQFDDQSSLNAVVGDSRKSPARLLLKQANERLTQLIMPGHDLHLDAACRGQEAANP